MADSQSLIEFKRLAGIGSWDQAFSYCNGLSLTEMLRGLDSLSGEGLLTMKRNAPSYAGRLGWERIAFAITVVAEGKVGTFPGMSVIDTGRPREPTAVSARSGNGGQRRELPQRDLQLRR
jgi:hypothetical protein